MADMHTPLDPLRAFAESFHFTMTDSFYSDCYIGIHEPDAVTFRLGNGSQLSKHIAKLEDRRIEAIKAAAGRPQLEEQASYWKDAYERMVAGVLDISEKATAKIDVLQNGNTALLARASQDAETIKALREALEAIDSLEVMEINPSNYDHEIVCELNSNAVQASLIARAALAGSAS